MGARRLVRLGGWTAIVVATLLAGCAPRRPAPPAPPVPPPPTVKPVALDPESYMAFTASSALFAVRASDMAEARGSTARLKKFASRVVMDQTGIGAQLNFAGRRINLLPSSRLLPQHQTMLEELAASTEDFDAIYRRFLGQVLSEAARAHRAFEASGSSPTLRQVAAFAAPICERHLEQLRVIR